MLIGSKLRCICASDIVFVWLNYHIKGVVFYQNNQELALGHSYQSCLHWNWTLVSVLTRLHHWTTTPLTRPRFSLVCACIHDNRDYFLSTNEFDKVLDKTLYHIDWVSEVLMSYKHKKIYITLCNKAQLMLSFSLISLKILGPYCQLPCCIIIDYTCHFSTNMSSTPMPFQSPLMDSMSIPLICPTLRVSILILWYKKGWMKRVEISSEVGSEGWILYFSPWESGVWGVKERHMKCVEDGRDVNTRVEWRKNQCRRIEDVGNVR